MTKTLQKHEAIFFIRMMFAEWNMTSTFPISIQIEIIDAATCFQYLRFSQIKYFSGNSSHSDKLKVS